jgi:hypothetical protein
MAAGVALQWEFLNNQRKAPAMKLSEDCASVQLDINGKFSAAQLDTLLRKLALLRAEMTPAVPMNRAELEETNSNVLVEDMPGLSIAARQSGGFRLWMRHRGYGWLAYQIDDRSAAGISSYLSTRIRPEVNLINNEGGISH